MKKLFICVLLITASFNNLHSQKTTVDEKQVTVVFECDSLKKDAIFSSINKWIALNYNSANNVIQMSDKQAGTIIVKGINTVTYDNPTKAAYPKSRYVQSSYDITLNHTIQINVKDGRFRSIYKVSGIVKPVSTIPGLDVLQEAMFLGINLNGSTDQQIEMYRLVIERLYKGAMMGKKRKRKVYEAIPKSFESLNKAILRQIELRHLSLYNSVLEKKTDDW